MARVSCFLAVLIAVCSQARAESHKPSWEYSTAEIRGWHAQAVVVALREFQKNQGGKTERGEPVYGDLAHYTLKIAKSPPDQLPLECARQECVRVSFVPDMSAKDYRDVVLGGRTSYGIEVSYDVARRSMKIVKTSFAR
jgi:hypothetical protein